MIFVSSDLHLEDVPSAEYRWGFFPWLREQVQLYGITYVLLLGDTSDKKDRHPSSFVNRLIDELHALGEMAQIIILRGNHDYIEASEPFLRFVNKLSSKVAFITQPKSWEIDGKRCLLLPNSRQPEEDWKALSFTEYEYLFMHQTLTGAIAENGMALTGVDRAVLKDFHGIVISGDVHVPQTLGDNFVYVGSPYHVHFADKFHPRCLLIDGKSIRDITYPTLSRHTISLSSPDQLNALPINKGDQIKIRYAIGNALDWDKTRRQIHDICHTRGYDLHELKFVRDETSLTKELLDQHDAKLKDLSPDDILEQFCSTTNVKGQTKQYGVSILHEQTGSTKAIPN